MEQLMTVFHVKAVMGCAIMAARFIRFSVVFPLPRGYAADVQP
ncbi:MULTISPECIES: hypothetical protein [Halomonas]|nr:MULTISPECIES: hypothetical protein [Halomonas]